MKEKGRSIRGGLFLYFFSTRFLRLVVTNSRLSTSSFDSLAQKQHVLYLVKHFHIHNLYAHPKGEAMINDEKLHVLCHLAAYLVLTALLCASGCTARKQSAPVEVQAAEVVVEEMEIVRPSYPSTPAFSCMPPKPSARADLTQYLPSGDSPRTLEELNVILCRAMNSAGYIDRRYMPLECDLGGYAIVARLEQFNSDGTPVEGDGRWMCDWTPYNGDEFSLASYLRALFSAAPGHFRVLVFIISGEEIVPRQDCSATEGMTDAWFQGGGLYIPKNIARKPMTAEHKAMVFIYQFTKTTADQHFVRKSLLPGQVHLERSGLAQAFTE